MNTRDFLTALAKAVKPNSTAWDNFQRIYVPAAEVPKSETDSHLSKYQCPLQTHPAVWLNQSHVSSGLESWTFFTSALPVCPTPSSNPTHSPPPPLPAFPFLLLGMCSNYGQLHEPSKSNAADCHSAIQPLSSQRDSALASIIVMIIVIMIIMIIIAIIKIIIIIIVVVVVVVVVALSSSTPASSLSLPACLPANGKSGCWTESCRVKALHVGDAGNTHTRDCSASGNW